MADNVVDIVKYSVDDYGVDIVRVKWLMMVQMSRVERLMKIGLGTRERREKDDFFSSLDSNQNPINPQSSALASSLAETLPDSIPIRGRAVTFLGEPWNQRRIYQRIITISRPVAGNDTPF